VGGASEWGRGRRDGERDESRGTGRKYVEYGNWKGDGSRDARGGGKSLYKGVCSSWGDWVLWGNKPHPQQPPPSRKGRERGKEHEARK